MELTREQIKHTKSFYYVLRHTFISAQEVLNAVHEVDKVRRREMMRFRMASTDHSSAKRGQPNGKSFI